MSALSKFFSLVIFGGLSFVSIQALGMTTTNTDELYADTITLQRSSAEVPSSIDVGTTSGPAVQEDYIVESVSDLEAVEAPKTSKKISSKTKKSVKN